MQYEHQYINLCNRILDQGHWVTNERTGKRCLTVINQSFTYTPDDAPLLSIKKSFPVSAVAELLGYLRGYTYADQFSAIGSPTWFANANETDSWLNNPNRIGENHIGDCYGAIGRNFGGVNLIHKVVDNLSNGVDDRGEIITFWKPDEFDKAALRPCMYSHHFSILCGKLYLTSYQRSCDVPLGLNFNSIQCYALLAFMARICNIEVGECYHHIVNAHIYEDQIEGVNDMLKNKPLDQRGKIAISDWIYSLDDLESERHARDYISVSNYYHYGKIDFPMTA